MDFLKDIFSSVVPKLPQAAESISPDFYMRLLQTAVVVLVGYLLAFIFVKVVNRRVKDLRARHAVRKNIIYFVSFAVLIIVIFIWAHKMRYLTIFLGIASAGIALALQEVLLCVAGWFLIVTRHPFDVGDRVEFGGVKGDVIDIRIFQTSLLEIGNWVNADQSTGRIANIPNSAVFKRENFNYNRGFEYIWNEIRVMVTFESDWRRAEEIMITHGREIAGDMEELAKRKIDGMTNKYMIYYGKLTPIVYTRIADSGIEVTLRYLVDAKKRRATETEITRRLLSDFEKEPHISFAYPTYRIVKA